MKGRTLQIAGMLGCLILGLGIANLAAQTDAPSESDIGRALRPAPPGLGPSQGVPILPAAPQAPQNPIVHRTKAQSSAVTAAPPATAPRPSIAFNTIQFAFNSAQLAPGSIETLRNLGNALNRELADQKAFLIEGHTDASGGLKYNMILSRRRADAVKNYLVHEAQVLPSRLQTVGKGPLDPINRADPYASENRRVVVINLGS